LIRKSMASPRFGTWRLTLIALWKLPWPAHYSNAHSIPKNNNFSDRMILCQFLLQARSFGPFLGYLVSFSCWFFQLCIGINHCASCLRPKDARVQELRHAEMRSSPQVEDICMESEPLRSQDEGSVRRLCLRQNPEYAGL
jgi:hypothetical protein